MKRTTISLPDDLAACLDREARRLDTSTSEVVREAPRSHLGMAGTQKRSIPFAGIGDSGFTNTARDFEEILRQEGFPDRRR